VLPAVVAVALAVAGTVAAACGDSSTPAGQGDTIINDTRDSSVRAPANPNDGATPTGEPDSAYQGGQPGEGGAYDDAPTVSFPGVAECSACTCGAARSYCFGGASAKSEPQAHVTPYAADASLPSCPMVDAGALGCTATPASCVMANPADDCACLALLLQPLYGCVLNCAYDGKTSSVYCPNP
jgi:hypothetical protein